MHRLKDIKEKLVEKVYHAVDENIDGICVSELGEVIDMIKDLEEAMYYCKLVEAMEKSPEDSMKYIYPAVATEHMKKEVAHD